MRLSAPICHEIYYGCVLVAVCDMAHYSVMKYVVVDCFMWSWNGYGLRYMQKMFG